MLAIIEVLFEALLAIILELVGEATIYGIFYTISGFISKSLKTGSDSIESLTDAAKTPETRILVVFLLIVGGAFAAILISFTIPKRVFNIGDITGISLLFTPLIMGLLSSFVGRWEKKHDRGPTFMATFLGGFIFGLAAAVTRLLFLFSQHQA